MRRIGVLMSTAGNGLGQSRVAAFLDGLKQLGWSDGHNVRIDIRWPASDADRYRRSAEELVALGPDVILASASVSVAMLQKITRSVPIVSRTLSTQLVQDSSRAWRGQAATPRDLARSNTA